MATASGVFTEPQSHRGCPVGTREATNIANIIVISVALKYTSSLVFLPLPVAVGLWEELNC